MAASSSKSGNDMNSFESSTYDSRLQKVAAFFLPLRVLTCKSVKHTVIKACNNKIEQGKSNVLFYVCVCSCLGGKKSVITFTVNSQCSTHLEGIVVVNCI